MAAAECTLNSKNFLKHDAHFELIGAGRLFAVLFAYNDENQESKWSSVRPLVPVN